MYLRILPDNQKLFFKEDIIERLSGVVKKAQTSIPPETFFKKDIFYLLELLKTCFDAFLHTSRSPETIFLNIFNFYCLEWLKTCFCAFAHTSRPPEIFFSKEIFFTIWSG
jgi:hypothetical protein